MNKLLRLALALFMWFHTILYADIEDLKLTQVREYYYGSDGKLSAEKVYDEDEILRETSLYYYESGRLIEEIKGGKLFAYEYDNGKLAKVYEARKLYYGKYEATGDFNFTEYKYNRYGNLIYRYESSVIKPGVVYKTKYEYDSNGKITWATLFENGETIMKIKCEYDSDGKLTDEKIASTDDRVKFTVKLKYDGNRLYSTNTETDNEYIGKTKYEYNRAGQLIRKYKFGYDVTACRPLDIFAN